MTFRELYVRFLGQTKIKRENWGGYWQWCPRTNDIIIYCKDGSQTSLRKSENMEFTIANLLADDWEVARGNEANDSGEHVIAERACAIEKYLSENRDEFAKESE